MMTWILYFLVGLFVFLISVYGVIKPYNLAKFFERIDAIGSKRRWANVEPANWNVSVVRIASIIMAISSGVFVALMLGTLR